MKIKVFLTLLTLISIPLAAMDAPLTPNQMEQFGTITDCDIADLAEIINDICPEESPNYNDLLAPPSNPLKRKNPTPVDNTELTAPFTHESETTPQILHNQEHEDLKRHTTVAQQSLSLPEGFKCRKCDKVFASKRSCGTHEGMHYKRTAFRRKGPSMQEEHESTFEFPCNQCKTFFPNKESLQSHNCTGTR